MTIDSPSLQLAVYVATVSSDSEDDDAEDVNLDVMSMTDFMSVLNDIDGEIEVRARVNVACTAPRSLDGRERADRVAVVLGEYTFLHWT